MRLVDLDPRWLGERVFVFRCPCCLGTPRALWISCKSIQMPNHEQVDLFRASGLEPQGRGAVVICTKEDTAWTIDGRDFSSITVAPSIDASKAGHWHGQIQAGQVK